MLLFIEVVIHMLRTAIDIFYQCVGVVLEECCTITAVDALAIQAKEQVHISGFTPESVRTRRTSDITHAHHISCLCDDVCDSICIFA